jgi:hypothetical protein
MLMWPSLRVQGSVVALLLAANASAFELEGMAPGMQVTPEMVKGCALVKDLDTGMPLFRCESTLEGDPAELRLVVLDNKLIGIEYVVENARTERILEALTKRYGEPVKTHLNIEAHVWLNQEEVMGIGKFEYPHGYVLTLYNRRLLHEAQAAMKGRVKKGF